MRIYWNGKPQQGRLSWTQALPVAGMTLFLLGGMAADSPGTGYLWAGLIVLVGLALMALGQRVERRNKNACP